MSRYPDLNTQFFESNVETDSTTVDKQTIINSLLRLLQTPKGADPFNREYGCNIYSLLFNINLSTSDARMFLYMDITTFEPRVDISPADINLARIDEHTYQLTCSCRIPALNNESITLSTTIEE